MTFKVVLLAKKRADISFEKFRDYYSNHHIQMMNGLLKHGAAIHRRNFVIHADPENPGEYDVISEVFYEDLSVAQATMQELSDPELHRKRVEDEANFLIPESERVFMVETDTTVFRPIEGFV